MLKKYSINNQIKAKEVRVIDENGENIGILPVEKALTLAQEKNLDLVEIVEKTNPPVTRICDYNKLLYQEEKSERKQRIKERSDEMKHIRLSFNIGKHDMEIKAHQIEEFLDDGLKVQIELVLRGREKGHRELAENKLKEFLTFIGHSYKIVQDIKSSPRGLTIIIN